MSLRTSPAISIPPAPPFSHSSESLTLMASPLHLSSISLRSAEVSVENLFTATTAGMLNTFVMCSTCLSRFGSPFSRALRFSLLSSAFGTPTLNFRALTVETITTELGLSPDILHLISAPRSAPKPASSRRGRRRGHLCGHYGVAAMCYVCERSAMYEGRGTLECLNQVRLKSILQQRCHSTLCVQLSCCYGLSCPVVGYHYPCQPFLKVVYVARQAEYSHYLGSHRDVEAILSRNSVNLSTETVYNEPELPAGHVYTLTPNYPSGVNVQGISLVYVVVKHCCQQVIRCSDCMQIPCNVEVYVLHWHYL